MGQNVLPAELSLLMVNASITKPDGTVLILSNPAIEDTAYKLTTQVNSFGNSDVGSYTCNATLKSKSAFLTGMGQLVSNPINIEIGMAIPSLPLCVGMCAFLLVPPCIYPSSYISLLLNHQVMNSAVLVVEATQVPLLEV